MLRFTELVLGTAPRNPETYRDYIASMIVKRKDLTDEEKEEMKAEEIEEMYKSLKATEDRGWTTFLKDERSWFVLDYWVKGYFKTAFAVLQETTDLSKITAYKQAIDRYLFVFGEVNGARRQKRKVYFNAAIPQEQEELECLERPLRAMTPKGLRTSLARSDVIPDGSTMSFTIRLLQNKKIDMEAVQKTLEYGELFGMGQWASGGWGTFEVEKFEEIDDDKDVEGNVSHKTETPVEETKKEQVVQRG
jgi:hypothetical protein